MQGKYHFLMGDLKDILSFQNQRGLAWLKILQTKQLPSFAHDFKIKK